MNENIIWSILFHFCPLDPPHWNKSNKELFKNLYWSFFKKEWWLKDEWRILFYHALLCKRKPSDVKSCSCVVNDMPYLFMVQTQSFIEHLRLLQLVLNAVCCFRWERPPGALHIRLGPNASVCIPPQALSVGSKFLLFLLLLPFHLLYSPYGVSPHRTQSPSVLFGPSNIH